MRLTTIFALAFLSIGSFCFASQYERGHVSKYHTLNQIINNSDTCVKGIYENRIYLQEDNIHATDRGLLLVLNKRGDFVRLNEMHSDKLGCFVNAPNEIWVDVKNVCKECGEKYIISCKNPNCPSNKR